VCLLQCVVSVGSRANYVVVFARDLVDNAIRNPLGVPVMSHEGARASLPRTGRSEWNKTVVPEHRK
jgi:hypothetical protein